MTIDNFLNLTTDEQVEYLIKLDNEKFNNLLDLVSNKDYKLNLKLRGICQTKKEVKNLQMNTSSFDIIKDIDIKDIYPNPVQPRKRINEDTIQDMATSIKNRGLIVPISVIYMESKYYLIAGQLRIKAHELLGLNKIKSFVISNTKYTLKDFLIDSLIENTHRNEMDVFDTALSIKKALEQSNGISMEEFGKVIGGKSKAYISQYNYIASIDDKIKEYIYEKNLNNPTIIYMICKHTEDFEKRKELVDKYTNGLITKDGLSKLASLEKKVDIKTSLNEDDNKFKKILDMRGLITSKKYNKLSKDKQDEVDKKLETIEKIKDEIKNIIS